MFAEKYNKQVVHNTFSFEASFSRDFLTFPGPSGTQKSSKFVGGLFKIKVSRKLEKCGPGCPSGVDFLAILDAFGHHFLHPEATFEALSKTTFSSRF